MERRRFSQTMASEWQTAFVVSHKMPWCALFTAVKNYNKSLENCKTFSSRPRPNVQDQDFVIQDQDQDQDFHFFVLEAPLDQDWSQGLHHWKLVSSLITVCKNITTKTSDVLCCYYYYVEINEN